MNENKDEYQFSILGSYVYDIILNDKENGQFNFGHVKLHN